MTGKQHAVLWLGLLLILVRMFTTKQWHDIWSGISNGQVIGSGGSSGSSGSGIKVPGVGGIPGLLPGFPGSTQVPGIPGVPKVGGVPVLNPFGII